MDTTDGNYRGTNASAMTHRPRAMRAGLAGIALAAAAIALAGCETAGVGSQLATTIDADQGSQENIASLTEVIRANPSDPAAYNVRGSAFGRAGRYQDAMRDFDQAIALNPRFFEAYANRALIWRSMGDLGRAAEDYNRAIQINPRYDTAYIGRGELYRRAGRANEAFNDFQKAIQLDTTDPRAYHRRGLVYQSRGQHDFAIDDFSTAISLQPNAPEPYNGRGLSYVAIGQLDNAFDDFNYALRLDDRVAESWANQALVYEKRGETAKARKSYQRALQLDSKYEPARTGLARVGGKYSDDWHHDHLIDPRSVVPESIMPGYPFLAETPLVIHDVAAHLRTNQLIGVPYSDDMVEMAEQDLAAQADPDSDGAEEVLERYPGAVVSNFDGNAAELTELDAMIAYLQVLGTLVDFEAYEPEANYR